MIKLDCLVPVQIELQDMSERQAHAAAKAYLTEWLSKCSIGNVGNQNGDIIICGLEGNLLPEPPEKVRA